MPKPTLAQTHKHKESRSLKGLSTSARTALKFSDIANLESLLRRKGCFTLPLSPLVKKTPAFSRLKILRASDTPMWPMGTHYWVRDNALIAQRLIGITLADRPFSLKLRKLGRDLLESGLTIMSTRSQLTRFRNVIESPSDTYAKSATSWPQIFLGIADNLSGEKHEGWAHKQDAWQILAHTALVNLACGKLDPESLTIENREFLSLVAPFLARVRFYQQENSGSWEELEAIRSSVLAWDMAVLQQIYQLSCSARFSFLEDGFREFRGSLHGYAITDSFSEFLKDLLHKGAEVLKRSIPFESPLYPVTNPRHRLADAALIYLLQLDTPRLVADILDLPESWIEESETKLLKTIATLYDPRTGGHRRYKNDSYQRFGFFRDDTIAKLNEMYGAPSGDASGHFTGRDGIVPSGPEAAWSHFTWQLSSWSGRRYQETLEPRYLKMQHHYFNQGLRTIPTRALYSVELSQKGTIHLIKLPAYRCPECYLTEADSRGKQFVFPSPHTPLNWATGEALAAFSAIYQNLR